MKPNETELDIFSDEYRPFYDSVINCMNFYNRMQDGISVPSYQMTYDMAQIYYYYSRLSPEEITFLRKDPVTKEFADFSQYVSECFFSSLKNDTREKLLAKAAV